MRSIEIPKRRRGDTNLLLCGETPGQRETLAPA